MTEIHFQQRSKLHYLLYHRLHNIHQFKMQRLPSGEVVITPRNFKLLEELEKSEKGQGEMSGHITYGLLDNNDIFMKEWSGSILGPPRVSSSAELRAVRVIDYNMIYSIDWLLAARNDMYKILHVLTSYFFLGSSC